jgi:hypothetical protein
MKLAKPLTTTLGAVALTLVAAGSALAVNIGILSQNGNSAVGALDTVATTTTVAADVSQPGTQYVTIYVDDPNQAVSAVDTTPQPQVVSAPVSNVTYISSEHEGGHEYEGAEYDD